ncbi:MAG TPA: UDP-glucose 4-epimerase GalE [Pseudomonadota bacterium]|nr:UDP-glucose 4-epimerase GalE [Pseudomonadota bacterium]
MSLLVTGGVGFVGSHFVRAAVEAGRQVVILDDLSGSAAAGAARVGAAGADCAIDQQALERITSLPGVTLQIGDIGDSALVSSLCRTHGVTALLHFAGKIQVGESVRRPELHFDINFARALSLLEAVRHAGVGQVVFSSTAAVYGTPQIVPIPESARCEPDSPYGRSKRAFEWALLSAEVAHGLRWAALRYFNAAGAHPDGSLREAHHPETHLIPLALDAGLGKGAPLSIFGSDYPTPDGTCIRDYIHVWDLAQAHLLALAELERGHSLGPLNLGTGHGYSVQQVLQAASEVLGRPVPQIQAARRPGDPPQLIADPSAARERLCFIPRRSDLHVLLEDALRSRR